jgi:creatinine amidohydrolase
VLLGDHGGYQTLLKQAATELNKEWAGTGVRAYFVEDYYRVGQTAYVQALRNKGLSEAQIGSHAGAADTSLMLALDPSLVRTDRLAGRSAADGTAGDPALSSAALGQLGVDLIVSHTVAAIRKARSDKR